jgi:hypothetical protein
MGQRLGLRVDKEDGEVFILEVQPGLVQEWNEANPDCQVGHATVGRMEECGGIHWKHPFFQAREPPSCQGKLLRNWGFILVLL